MNPLVFPSSLWCTCVDTGDELPTWNLHFFLFHGRIPVLDMPLCYFTCFVYFRRRTLELLSKSLLYSCYGALLSFFDDVSDRVPIVSFPPVTTQSLSDSHCPLSFETETSLWLSVTLCSLSTPLFTVSILRNWEVLIVGQLTRKAKFSWYPPFHTSVWRVHDVHPEIWTSGKHFFFL